MSKTFDKLYNSVLRETMGTNVPVGSAANSNQPQPGQPPQPPQPQQAQTPQPGQPQTAQNNQQYQKTPTPNSTAPQPANDNDLMKALQQKMQDQQFKQQLLQMLNAPAKR